MELLLDYALDCLRQRKTCKWGATFSLPFFSWLDGGFDIASLESACGRECASAIVETTRRSLC